MGSDLLAVRLCWVFGLSLAGGIADKLRHLQYVLAMRSP